MDDEWGFLVVFPACFSCGAELLLVVYLSAICCFGYRRKAPDEGKFVTVLAHLGLCQTQEIKKFLVGIYIVLYLTRFNAITAVSVKNQRRIGFNSTYRS